MAKSGPPRATPPTQPRSFNASPSPSTVVAPPIAASIRRPPPTFRLPATVPTGVSAPTPTPTSAPAPASTPPPPWTSTPTPIPMPLVAGMSGVNSAWYRPLPSGPRALRAVNNTQPMSMSSMNMAPTTATIPPTAGAAATAAATTAAPAAPPYRSFSGGSYIPRRPSADRDWERERAWQHQNQGQQRGSRVRGPGPGSGWR
ncbi:hypothetical protein AX14_012924 [Amanita brunnescens Koide BX004]|nr:hypothetical protein AX14_012924 [Amanita brunnescens Koide BX004]